MLLPFSIENLSFILRIILDFYLCVDCMTLMIDHLLSNGHSPANLSNLSTRRKFARLANSSTRQNGRFWKMGRTRYIRRHLPSRVARTRQTRRHSPSRVARTRQTRRHSPSRVARTRQTRERRVWHVLCEFSESGESGEFGECRLDRFMHIKYVICA